MPIVYLSLGSNQGDRKVLLDSAIQVISQTIGEVEAVSSYIETEPLGFVSSSFFLNAAVRVRTNLSPIDLLYQLQHIERLLGRTKKSVNGVYYDRTMDIDILLYDELEVDLPNLRIPHPRMKERDFVMIPLREILE